jgi:hypothetical protein
MVLGGIASIGATGGGLMWLSDQSGAKSTSMTLENPNEGCISKPLKRPENGTIKSVTITRFEQVNAHIKVRKEKKVSELVVRPLDSEEVLHRATDIDAGVVKLSFSGGEHTKFEVSVVGNNGSVIDILRFKSKCYDS